MKKFNYSGLAAICVALSFFVIGCTAPAPKAIEAPVEIKPDMEAVKAEIQAIESSWAAADNARDANAVAAFYSDDAISLSNNKPMIVGKTDILNDITESLAKRAPGSTVAYDLLEVYGNENVATEIGKSTQKDASGNVISTGKYMAIWEKRDGKFICIRDIYNEDAKEK